MKCYFCVSVSNDQESARVYGEMLEVALKSAATNTNLDLVVIYDGPQGHYYEKIIGKYGATIVRHTFSQVRALPLAFPRDYLLQKYGRAFDYNKLKGTFLRLDIPDLDSTDDVVLYSDIDVVFQPGFNEDGLLKELNYLRAGPEFSPNPKDFNYFNAGILLLKLKSIRPFTQAILKDINQGIPNKEGLFDQGYLNDRLFGKHDPLPLEYNWKPYWGYNSNAKIIHFHGIKPGASYLASGFGMNKEGLMACFWGRKNNLGGFLYYLEEYFSYLNKKPDKKWLMQLVNEILEIPDPSPVQASIPLELLNKKIVFQYFVDRIKKIKRKIIPH